MKVRILWGLTCIFFFACAPRGEVNPSQKAKTYPESQWEKEYQKAQSLESLFGAPFAGLCEEGKSTDQRKLCFSLIAAGFRPDDRENSEFSAQISEKISAIDSFLEAYSKPYRIRYPNGDLKFFEGLPTHIKTDLQALKRALERADLRHHEE